MPLDSHDEYSKVKTEKRQDEAQKVIKALSIALEGIVAKYERDHLEKLRPENDDTVSFGPNFFQEIERLDAIGFISPIKRDGIVAIQNEHGTPGQLFHLREYVKLTEKGKNYLNVTVSFSREANTTLHNSLPS